MLAMAWGFAEATLFFIVPDVLLSWIALRDARGAWRACLWALAGAMLGGSLMYLWGMVGFESAVLALDWVPAISRSLCGRVNEEVGTHGLGSLFRGPLTGVPYKIYAVHAGAAGLSLALFLLISVPARLLRFVAITGLTIALCRLFARVPIRGRRIIHLTIWAVFYAWYFWRFSG
jgi:membrane protein YqaA with SNARE-associated domain